MGLSSIQTSHQVTFSIYSAGSLTYCTPTSGIVLQGLFGVQQESKHTVNE